MQTFTSVPNDSVAIIVDKIDLKNKTFYIRPDSVSIGKVDSLGYFTTEDGSMKLPAIDNQRFFNDSTSKCYAFLTTVAELKKKYPGIEDVSFLLYYYFQDVLKSSHLLVGGENGAYVCSADYSAYSDKIVGSASKKYDESAVKKEDIPDLPGIIIPSEEKVIDSIGLEQHLKENLFGIDDILEDIATIIANNQRAKHKAEVQSILSVGPSGSGKTATFELAAEFLNIPITIYDCNQLTAQGYVGESIPDIMKKVYESSGRDIEKAQKSILVLDEFDKLQNRGSNVKDIDVQYAVLKLFDGYSYSFETKKNGSSITIDSSFMTIAALGAFPELFERKAKTNSMGFKATNEKKDENVTFTTQDFVQFGIIAEICGRLSDPYVYKALTKDDLRKALVEAKKSLLKLKLESYLRDFGCETVYDDAFIDALVEKCMIDLVGGRGISKAISKTFIKLDRELNHRKEQGITIPKKLVLTKELVENNRSFNI